MTFCGRTMTFCGDIMTFCGRTMTFCGNCLSLIIENQQIMSAIDFRA